MKAFSHVFCAVCILIAGKDGKITVAKPIGTRFFFR